MLININMNNNMNMNNINNMDLIFTGRTFFLASPHFQGKCGGCGKSFDNIRDLGFSKINHPDVESVCISCRRKRCGDENGEDCLNCLFYGYSEDLSAGKNGQCANCRIFRAKY